jgi:Helix-turn-helix domain
VTELASFSETSRQRALERFELLRAHLEDGRPLAAIVREARLSYRTLQYWLERYRSSGLAALARKPRTDRGCRRKLFGYVARGNRRTSPSEFHLQVSVGVKAFAKAVGTEIDANISG